MHHMISNPDRFDNTLTVENTTANIIRACLVLFLPASLLHAQFSSNALQTFFENLKLPADRRSHANPKDLSNQIFIKIFHHYFQYILYLMLHPFFKIGTECLKYI